MKTMIFLLLPLWAIGTISCAEEDVVEIMPEPLPVEYIAFDDSVLIEADPMYEKIGARPSSGWYWDIEHRGWHIIADMDYSYEQEWLDSFDEVIDHVQASFMEDFYEFSRKNVIILFTKDPGYVATTNYARIDGTLGMAMVISKPITPRIATHEFGHVYYFRNTSSHFGLTGTSRIQHRMDSVFQKHSDAVWEKFSHGSKDALEEWYAEVVSLFVENIEMLKEKDPAGYRLHYENLQADSVRVAHGG